MDSSMFANYERDIFIGAFLVGVVFCGVSWALWHFVLSHIHIYWR